VVVLVAIVIGVIYFYSTREGGDLDEDLGQVTVGGTDSTEAGSATEDGGAGGEEGGVATEEVVQLRVTSEPEGAEVYIGDERQEGMTPLELSSLPTGEEVTVAAKLAGYRRAEKQVTISDELQELLFKLQAMDRRVTLSTNVRANFVVDGERVGTGRRHTLEKVALPLNVSIEAPRHKVAKLSIGEDAEWTEVDEVLVHEHPTIALERVAAAPRPPRPPVPQKVPPEVTPPEKTPEKAPAKTPEKAPAKTPEKAPAKTPEKAPASTIDENPYD
jgi:hypothetical protein